MENKKRFVKAVGDVVSRSQLESIMIAHNALFDSQGVSPTFEAIQLADALYNAPENEMVAFMESLSEDELNILVESGFINAIKGIPKIFKAIPKMFSATGRSENRINKGNTLMNKFAKNSEILKKANANNNVKLAEKMQNKNSILQGKMQKIFNKSNDSELGQMYQANKANPSSFGIHQRFVNTQELNQAKAELNSLKKAEKSAINKNASELENKLKTAKPEEQAMLRTAYAENENTIKSLYAKERARVQKKIDEHGVQGKEFLSNKPSMPNEQNINQGASVKRKAADGFNTAYQSRTMGPTANTVNGATAAAEGVTVTANGITIPTELFNALLTRVPGLKYLGRLSPTRSLSKAIVGKAIKLGIIGGIGYGGYKMVSDSSIGDYIKTAIGGLAGGYITSKAAGAFGFDSTGEQAVSGIMGALVGAYLTNNLFGGDEARGNEMAKDLAALSPSEQQTASQLLGIPGFAQTIQPFNF